jgi:hypothetical protein
LFEDFNGVPFPQFFGQKEAYKRYNWFDKLMMNFKQLGAFIWWYSGLNTWGAIFELFGGTWKELGMSFLDRVIWFFYRINM